MKCSCYHEIPTVKYLSEFEQGLLFAKNGGKIIKKIDILEPRCWGTKDRDICSCGGDPTECDFYPEKRKYYKDNNIDQINELEFYRYYINKNDLEYDVLNEYRKWKKDKRGSK